MYSSQYNLFTVNVKGQPSPSTQNSHIMSRGEADTALPASQRHGKFHHHHPGTGRHIPSLWWGGGLSVWVEFYLTLGP